MSWCTCCHYLCQAIVYDFLQGRYNYTEQRCAERQRNVRGGVCSLHILASVKKGDHSHTQLEMFMNYSRRLLLLTDHLLSCGTWFLFSFVEKVRNLHVIGVENVFSVETTARSETASPPNHLHVAGLKAKVSDEQRQKKNILREKGVWNLTIISLKNYPGYIGNWKWISFLFCYIYRQTFISWGKAGKPYIYST